MDFQPTTLLYGGDTSELGCISFFNKNKVRLIEGERLSVDYALLDTMLVKHVGLVERHVNKLVYLEGNHEYRVKMLIDEDPQSHAGFIEMEDPKVTKITPLGFKWIERRKMYDAGGVKFFHGDYKDGYTAANHAKAIAVLYHRNMVYGHFHSEMAHTEHSPIEDEVFTATSVGTMGHTNPEWKKNAPSGWVNSFFVAEGEPGAWNTQVVRIFKDGFTYKGVKYT